MPSLTTVFSELLKLCPRYQFDKAVDLYEEDRYVKSFSTWQQFITILYSQVKQKDSLRDIESGLLAHNHSGALPSFMVVTDGKKHDVRVVKENSFPMSPDSIASPEKGSVQTRL